MVRVITQETFDEVVTENMTEFEMTREEAVNEAKEQFKSQGVNLSNIVFNLDSEDHSVIRALKALEKSDNDEDEIIRNCRVLEKECSKGLAEKVLSTKHNGYEVLLRWTETENPLSVRKAAILALTALLNGNPDPLTEAGIKTMMSSLDEPELVVPILNLVVICSVRHEYNRQNIIRSGLLDKFDELSDEYIVEIARVWQALVQDDDIRVPFGKAHDQARCIVEEHDALTRLKKAVSEKKEPNDLAVLLSCLSSLSVRNEYCQVVADGGGLKRIMNILVDPNQNLELLRSSLLLLKTLAGNDNVKYDIGALNGGISIIINAMSKKVSYKAVCYAGCGAITAICLRSPENAKQVMDAGGDQLITQIMKIHSDNDKVQVICANAIRNIVSRSRDYCNSFIDLDIENLLQDIIRKHGKTDETADAAAKAALRDLELKVELKELWTGISGQKVQND